MWPLQLGELGKVVLDVDSLGHRHGVERTRHIHARVRARNRPVTSVSVSAIATPIATPSGVLQQRSQRREGRSGAAWSRMRSIVERMWARASHSAAWPSPAPIAVMICSCWETASDACAGSTSATGVKT